MGDMLTQTTEPKLDYLMTLRAELDEPQNLDLMTRIYNVRGGKAKGPAISAKLIPPSADWLRSLESGVRRLNVRATLQTDDGDLIFISYNGVLSPWSDEVSAKYMRGEPITPADGIYGAVAPLFQTSSSKHAWLNGVQAIGKWAESRKVGDERYIQWDIFVVR
jgi:hypothetical protein